MHLFGYSLVNNKSISFSLVKITGIGLKNSFFICHKLGISPKLLVKDLNISQINNIKKFIQKNFLFGKDLDKVMTKNILDLLELKTYRGLRHYYSLPVRGQGTQTNAKTQKSLGKSRIKNNYHND